MIEQSPSPAPARLAGPSSFRILIAGAAALALAVAAAVALATSVPATSPVSALGPGPADGNGFIGLTAAEAQQGAISGGGPLQMGGPGGRGGHSFHAITIAAKDGSKLSLKTEDGWTRTITVESDTTITKGGVAVTLNDLNVGDTIAFRETKNTDGSFKINEIRVFVPQVGGSVTAVGGNTLTLRLRDGSSKTVTVTDSTKYFVGARAASKADAKVGSDVTAQGTVSGDTFTAISVTVRPDVVAGQVTAKTSDTITITTRDGGTVSVKVDANTTYRIPGKSSATLADISVGMQIAAEGVRNADNSFNASVVGGAAGVRDGFNRGPGRGFGGPRGSGPNPGGSPAPSAGTTSTS